MIVRIEKNNNTKIKIKELKSFIDVLSKLNFKSLTYCINENEIRILIEMNYEKDTKLSGKDFC